MIKDTYTEPEQKKGGPRLLLLISLLLVVGLGLLGWLIFARQTPAPSSVSTNPHFSATSAPVSKGSRSPRSCRSLSISSRQSCKRACLLNRWPRSKGCQQTHGVPL
jgi:hypothetical protein